MDKQKKMELLDQKAHSDLFEHGHFHEQMVETIRGNQLMHNPQNPFPNENNAALRAMQKIDPYAHLRDKTQMRKVNGRWQLTEM
jgi:hypothetical protein